MQTKDLVVDFLYQNWSHVLINASLVGLIPLAELVALPWFYGRLMASLNDPLDHRTHNLLLFGMFMVVLGLQCLQLFRDIANQWLIPALETFVKTTVVNRVLERSENNCNPMSSGDLVYLLTTVSEMTTTWLTWMNDFVLPYTLTFIITIITFTRYDWIIGLVFTLFLGLLGVVIMAAPQRCMSLAQHHDASMADIHTNIEELIHNVDAVQTYNRRESEIEALRDRMSNQAFRYYHRVNVCTRRYRIIVIPLLLCMLYVFVVRSRRLLQQKRVTHQHFVSVFLVLIGIFGSIFWVTDTLNEMVLDGGHMLSFSDHLRDKVPSTPRASPTVSPPPGALGLWRVTFAHHGQPPVLRERTMVFASGQRTALLGPVGSGKTTILRILAGFCEPQGGDAFVRGRWYSQIPITELRQMIGYVPQNPVLFRGSIIDNVMYGAPEGTTEQDVVDYIAQWTGDTLTARLREDVGPLGKKLSGGQRQMVWCLRMMLRPPSIILLDEPTASMDESNKDNLLRLLDALVTNEQRTVVMVTHDPYLLQRSSHQVHL